MNEIIFEVREDEADGGYTATALGYGIHTQGETLEELRAMVKDAVHCYFDETMQARRLFGCILCGKKSSPMKLPRDVDGPRLVKALEFWAIRRPGKQDPTFD